MALEVLPFSHQVETSASGSGSVGPGWQVLRWEATRRRPLTAESRAKCLRPHPAPGGPPSWPRMDRETRLFAENYFRSARGPLPGRLCPTPARVDWIEKPESFSYADFFKGYLLPNVPCVFSSTFTEGWGSRRRWVTADGKPDFDHLLRNYGQDGTRPPGPDCGDRRGRLRVMRDVEGLGACVYGGVTGGLERPRGAGRGGSPEPPHL